MARTKASVGAKISFGKSTKARAVCAAPSSSNGYAGGSSDKPGRSSSGGNPVCPRETPKWQRPITNFFNQGSSDGKNDVEDDSDVEVESEACASTSRKPKRNAIESDDEESYPQNSALEESYELQPLNVTNNHKMKEYYPEKRVKNKGVGKKTKNKENVDNNTEGARGSLKRSLSSSDDDQPDKRLKSD